MLSLIANEKNDKARPIPLSIQTNWTRIPHIPSMITVATSPAATAPPTMNRSANALLTPCALMIPRAPATKVADPAFKDLLHRNHSLWLEIQKI